MKEKLMGFQKREKKKRNRWKTSSDPTIEQLLELKKKNEYLEMAY